MPSQSRALEASFEPSDKPAAGLGTDPGPMLEDFDSFFEKLNKLEPSDWRKPGSAEPSAASVAAGKAFGTPAAKKAIDPKAAASTGAAAAKTAAQAAGKAAAKSTMGDPLAGLRAAFAHAKKTQAEPKPGFRRKLPSALRFAMTALVLFAVGMGIGWAALSLPGKGGDASTASAPEAAPEKSLIVESKLDTLLAKQAADKDKASSLVPLPMTETSGALTAAKSEAAKQDNTAKADSAAKDANAVLPVDLAAARMADASGTKADAKTDTKMADSKSDGKSDESATVAAAPLAATAMPAAASTKSEAKAKPAKAKATALASKIAPSVPSAPAIPSSTTDATFSADGHYAVQVGACRSTRCVENYRKIISALTQADRIRVISVPSDGKEAVQRVRVAPLDKAAAQQLRAALIQADSRLSEAYVVEVRP